MELTSNQKNLLEKFSRFLESENRLLMIQGYAGTGKTFMIGTLARQVVELRRSVSLLAPTGRAARVLQEKTGYAASTIHRAIYDLERVSVHEDEPGLFKYVFKTKEVASDNLDAIYFVDEASLVSDHRNETEFLQFGSGRLLADLIKFLRLGSSESRAKLVLVGDPAQLTPVGMDYSPALDPSYIIKNFGEHPEVVELTEVVRQVGDSAILQQATVIRESIRAGQQNRLVVSESPPDIVSTTAEEMIYQYANVIRENSSQKAICITQSNARCLGINHAVRAQLFGGDGRQPISATDSLLVIKNNLVTGFSNGDLVRVRSSDYDSIKKDVPVGKERVSLVFRKVVVGVDHPGGGVEHELFILENALHSPSRDISPLEQKALFVDFAMRHPRLNSQSEGFSEALRADPFFNALQVKFGYAMTCHKAQGGEWDHVFVVFEDSRTDLNSLRWAYTAITRASSRLTGVGMPNRRPWSKALGEEQQSNAPQRLGEFAQSTDVGDQYRTRWDGQFDAANPELLIAHHAIVIALDSTGVQIAAVNTRFGNYFWRYEIKRDQKFAIVQVSFNKKGETTVSVLSSVGTDEQFSGEISQAISDGTKTAIRNNKTVSYVSSEDFLQEFFSEVVQPKMEAANAQLIRVERLPYRERLHIGRGVEIVVIDVIYNGKGEITELVRVRGAEGLSTELALT